MKTRRKTRKAGAQPKAKAARRRSAAAEAPPTAPMPESMTAPIPAPMENAAMSIDRVPAEPVRRAGKGPPLNRPARIGVLSPAGRVVNRDQVVTHSHGNPDKSLKSFMNIGDAFVYDSSLKILDFAELVPVWVPEVESDRAAHVEQLNSLDYVFLRGSNYINPNGKWDRVTALLKQTDTDSVLIFTRTKHRARRLAQCGHRFDRACVGCP